MLRPGQSLAKGLYWIDVSRPNPDAPDHPDGEPAWRAWQAANFTKVRVLKSEPRPVNPYFGGPDITWYSFEVLTDDTTAFPVVQLGRPTRHNRPDLGPEEVTQTKPDPKTQRSLEEALRDFLNSLGDAGKVLLLAGVVYVLAKNDRSR